MTIFDYIRVFINNHSIGYVFSIKEVKRYLKNNGYIEYSIPFDKDPNKRYFCIDTLYNYIRNLYLNGYTHMIYAGRYKILKHVEENISPNQLNKNIYDKRKAIRK